MAATPAIAALDGAGVDYLVHEYRHDRRSTDYGAEAVDTLSPRLGVAAGQIFKTLVLDLGERRLGVAVVPVPRQLSLKAAARAFGVPKAQLAPAAGVTRVTGYVLGGVSPIGQKTSLPTVVDSSALHWDRILVSAGRRGLQIELAPADLIGATGARVAELAAG